jgi:polysaccharide biosynthesis protein PslH
MTPIVLWVVPRWPLPADDAARVGASAEIRGLISTGAVVDLLALVPQDEPIDTRSPLRELGVRNVHVIRTPSGSSRSRRLLRRLAGAGAAPAACTTAPYAAAEVRGSVERLIHHPNEHWDAIVLDGARVAGAFGRGARFERPAIAGVFLYRARDVEGELCAQVAPPARHARVSVRMLFDRSGRRFAEFERSVVAGTQAVATVSAADAAAFRRMCPHARIENVPFGLPFAAQPAPLPAPAPSEQTALELLFLGRMDSWPNRQGLTWFLDEVWPEAARRRPALRLAIAGSGDDRWLRTRALPLGARHLGAAEEVAPLHRASALGVVPLFFGSGALLRVVEGAAQGRGCLGTALGARGTNLEAGRAYLRAETREQWLRALLALDPATCRDVGQAAFVQARRDFDEAVQARRLRNLLDEIVAAHAAAAPEVSAA